MTKLRVGGPGFPGTQELLAARQALTTAMDSEEATLRAAREPSMKAPVTSSPKAQSVGAKIIGDEMKKPDSRIDWSRFRALREGGPEAIEAAALKFRSAVRLESEVISLSRLIEGIPRLDVAHDLSYFYMSEAKDEFALRQDLVRKLDLVEAMVEAAGESRVVANFPKAQLEALRGKLKLDLADLLAHRGPEVAKPNPTLRRPMPPPKPVFLDPTPAQQLPARVALSGTEVADLNSATQALEKLLAAPGLQARLLERSHQLGAAEHQLVTLLGGYALLADEAVSAPDYKNSWTSHGPDRAHYRARKHARPSPRNDESRQALRADLEAAMAAPDPVQALERALVERFVHELGLPAYETKDWRLSGPGVLEALAGEAFIPLRFMSEMGPHSNYRQVWPQMKQLFRQVIRAFAEGRFEEWKAGLPTSAQQLRSLTPAGAEAWRQGLETAREIKDSKGQPVVLTTREARGADRLWVTKNHTGSHGFDHPIGTPCLLAYLTNARTEAIIVEDPRWPQHAGRMYMRLTESPAGKPLIFVEGMARDNEYPCQREAEETLLLHAIQKAKAVGAQLIVSGYAADSIKSLGLAGTWTKSGDVRLVLTPTPLIEATVAFGPHDWVHQHTDIRTPNKDAFYVAP